MIDDDDDHDDDHDDGDADDGAMYSDKPLCRGIKRNVPDWIKHSQPMRTSRVDVHNIKPGIIVRLVHASDFCTAGGE